MISGGPFGRGRSFARLPEVDLADRRLGANIRFSGDFPDGVAALATIQRNPLRRAGSASIA
jgi:hypothetical protein